MVPAINERTELGMSNYRRPKPRTKYCGVYGIRCTVTGMIYIGGSVDMTGRWTHHRFTLRRGSHKTPQLQDHWNIHGEANFEFIVLERCDEAVLKDREDYWIKSTPDRLNWADSATPVHIGPSEVKKSAAVKRWANPAYRQKREDWLKERGEDGRFKARPGVVTNNVTHISS